MSIKKPVYLVTDSQDSQRIANELKLQTVSLRDYVFSEEELPILILGSGEEHCDSHSLSIIVGNYFASHGGKFTKVNIDAHTDIDADNAELSCATHMGTSLNTISSLEGAVFSGYQAIYTQPEVLRKLRARFTQQMIFGQDISTLEGIRGKNLHVTIDLDVLRNCDFCSGHFERGYVYLAAKFERSSDTYQGPTVNEFLKHLGLLRQNNTVFAVDVCGLDMHRFYGGNFQAGINAYQKVIDVFMVPF